jgi:hypothetical protein
MLDVSGDGAQKLRFMAAITASVRRPLSCVLAEMEVEELFLTTAERVRPTLK